MTQPTTVYLPLSAIDVGDRLRDVDQDHVDLIAVSMEDLGQKTAIWVREPNKKGTHRLIAGAHRIAAARQAGLAEVRVEIFAVDDLTAKMMEIDENLFRRELSPLDRAVFLAERKAVYEALHPAATRGGDRSPDQTDKLVSLVPSFADATALKLGIDARSVFRAIARARNIGPDVRKTIATTWLATKGAVLDALARLEPEDQRAVVAAMLVENGPKNVGAAIAIIRGHAPEQDDSAAQLAALMKGWRRADKAARDRFVEFLRREGVIGGVA